jgi:triacylglycerol lipase
MFRGQRVALAVLIFALARLGVCARVSSTAPPGETVVLLHGLGLRGWSMARLEHALARDGYRVVNLTYPSLTMPLEKIGGEWLPARLRDAGVPDDARLHFVTHSMGGVVVRSWLRECGTPANLGRVVMIAPPNSGSEVADRLKSFPPFRWFTGVNGGRLGTAVNSVPRGLGPWPTNAGELGVIAGDRSLNPLFSAWLPGPDDGKVSVASARLEGMHDFVVLHHSHTWLQWRRDSVTATQTFLRGGRFSINSAPSPLSSIR